MMSWPLQRPGRSATFSANVLPVTVRGEGMGFLWDEYHNRLHEMLNHSRGPIRCRKGCIVSCVDTHHNLSTILTSETVAVDETLFQQQLEHGRGAAHVVQVFHNILPAGFEVRNEWYLVADRLGSKRGRVEGEVSGDSQHRRICLCIRGRICISVVIEHPVSSGT